MDSLNYNELTQSFNQLISWEFSVLLNIFFIIYLHIDSYN